MAVGEHDGVGGDDPAVEGARRSRTRGGGGRRRSRAARRRSSSTWSRGLLVVDPHRADDVEAGALPRRGPRRPGRPGRSPCGAGRSRCRGTRARRRAGRAPARAVRPVGGACGPRSRRRGRRARPSVGGHAEPVEQLVALLGRVHLHLRRALQHPAGRDRRRVPRVAPAVVHLVEAHARPAGPPGTRRRSAKPSVRAGARAWTAPVEDVGVEVDDRPVEAAASGGRGPRRRPGPAGRGGGGRPRGWASSTSTCVAARPEPAHLLHGVGADPVPQRRVRRDDEHPLAPRSCLDPAGPDRSVAALIVQATRRGWPPCGRA